MNIFYGQYENLGSRHADQVVGQFPYCLGSMHTAEVSILPVTYTHIV